MEQSGPARIPTDHGEFAAYSFTDAGGLEHLAYVAATGDGHEAGEAPLVRVHSECLTGDVLGSRRCDCGSQLQRSLATIGASGNGVLVYLRGHEGRGIGLGHKLQTYNLQDDGLDTVEANEALGFPADDRDYGVAAAILRSLGVEQVRLLSNNPAKTTGLTEHGIDVVERLPLLGTTTSDNARYLETKRTRMEHSLPCN
jgi:3,4-dihydroxy 2-butanone 4-phosphate synthase/GTP cyclohydrolase II